MNDVNLMFEAAFELAAQWFYKNYPESFTTYDITKDVRVKINTVSFESKRVWFSFDPKKNGKVVSVCFTFGQIQEELDALLEVEPNSLEVKGGRPYRGC